MLSRAIATIGVIAALAVADQAGGSVAVAQGVSALARAAELPMLRAIDAPQAWRLTRGDGVIVGVLDTGADPNAPDLTGSVTTGPDYITGVDPRGYQPPHLHGTYIASIIAGHGSGPGRGEGIIGVAPRARILSIRVIVDKQEPGASIYAENAAYYDSIARGIRYAVGHGAGVINMSLGSVVPTRDMRQAVGYAISRGVVVVASAGNEGTGHTRFTPFNYPAAFPGVISVAAVDTSGHHASFSDHNASVVVSAPGVSVPGAIPGGQYVIASGTSPASALVAGVAALIRAKYPRLTPFLVAQAIVNSTGHRPPGGYSTGVGFGEVDARAALTVAARLAVLRPASGLSPGMHFDGGPPGPIAVVHRNYGLAALLLAVAVAAAVGFGLSTAALAKRTRDLRRRRQKADAPTLTFAAPPPAGPDTTGPETTGPDTTGPDTTGLMTTGPETTYPEVTGPDTSHRPGRHHERG